MIVGVGIDVTELDRIRSANERFARRFLARCFTSEEIEFCMAQADPAPRLASRFAAKEAAAKALGTGIARGVMWKEIEVRRESGQAPRLVLHGRARLRANTLGVTAIHVSLTHGRDFAAAFVVLEKLAEGEIALE